MLVFDPDEIDAAMEEARGRYLAGEGGRFAHVWRMVMDDVVR